MANQQFVFSYDPIGNRTAYEGDGIEGALTYFTNSLNQYTATSQPAESFQYDGNAGPPRNDGNLTQDGRYDYTYDGENRLISVTPRTVVVGSKKVAFAYDYRNRRVRKQVWAASVDGPFGGTVTWVPTEDRRFVYDGWNLLMELDGREEQTPPLTKFTWGLDLSGQNGNASVAGLHGAGGIGGLLAMADTKDTQETWDDVQHIYFHDANGNVGQVMDARAGSAYFGQTAARYEYYPFGGVLVVRTLAGTSGQKNPFLFSTKYRDSETGLYYYGERYLLPRLGQWVNRDPIQELGFVVTRQAACSVFPPRDPFADGPDGTGRLLEASPVKVTCSGNERCGRDLADSAVSTSSQSKASDELEAPNVYEYADNEPTDKIDPLGLSTKCGIRLCLCSNKGSQSVTVYGNSARAKAIIEARFGKGAQGCVTLVNILTGVEIYCTGSCPRIKRGRTPGGVPILDHECCHVCDYLDCGFFKYLSGAISDDCDKRPRGGFVTW